MVVGLGIKAIDNGGILNQCVVLQPSESSILSVTPELNDGIIFGVSLSRVQALNENIIILEKNVNGIF